MTPSTWKGLCAVDNLVAYVVGWVMRRFLAEQETVGATPHDPSVLPDAVAFVMLGKVTPDDVERVAKAFDPSVFLRRHVGQDMSFGVDRGEAPKGGPEIVSALKDVLGMDDAYRQFMAFMRLHPLSNANGRVSRLIWIRNMMRAGRFYEIEQTLVLGFLHTMYYQAIKDGEK